MYISTVDFCACGGCLNSLLYIGEPLVSLLSEHTVSFSSLLADRRNISPSDVVLATGGIRNMEELDIAREVSRTGRKVIAIGSCAVHGGIPGMAPLNDEMGTSGEERELPELLDEVEPLDSSMDIAFYVPGCPPTPEVIFEALKSVLEGYTPIHYDGTVCSDCIRRVEMKPVKAWSAHPGTGLPAGSCLLSHGRLCLGPITRGGCRAVCPSMGSICIGCRGPSDMVLSSQLHSMHSDMVKFVSLSTGIKKDRVEKLLGEMLESVHLFTRCDPVIRSKANEKITTG